MSSTKKFLYFKIAGGIALFSTLVFAAMTFRPTTQPVTVMAPYTFDAGNLLDGNTKAYRPWFENGAWQGDLIEYDVDANGVRTTDADVGSNPPTATGNNWLARATFADNEANVKDYWKQSGGSDSKRYIFTVNSDSGSQVEFLWDNLSDTQKEALDPAEFITNTSNNAYDSEILNFIRGDRSNEKSAQGGTLRFRYSLLGDIINSNPVYMGQPIEAYVIDGFPTFKFNSLSREGRVAVGANDGMLHVFDVADGSEVYAYIPSMLIDKLGRLSSSPYTHTYYVDGQLTFSSAIIDSAWKSLLTGGLGAGARGLFVLDVTDPDPTDDKVLFEKTHDDIGHIYGKPRLGRSADGTWNVYTGSGYDSANGVAKLVIMSLEDGSVSTISTGVMGGLSAVAIVSGPDRVVDYAFAGDTNGDLWKFSIADGSATRIYDGIADQPIMSAPVIGAHPNGGYMVFFGTGNMTSLVDVADPDYPTQSIYGIWDSPVNNKNIIVQQYLAEAEATFTTDDGTGPSTSNTEDVRYIVDSSGDPGNAPVNYYNSACLSDGDCATGWKVDLPNTGERVLATPSLRAGRVSVITNNPIGTDGEADDLEGDSWLMSLYWLTGGDGNDVAFNLSGDGVLNIDDRLTVDGTLVPPTGVSLGDGMISQPTIVRVADGIDMVFINGLRLPLPQIFTGGPFLSGHIDVHTDAPNSDPLAGGSVAPNKLTKHSEGYDVWTSDGLGRAVDGHVHAYDTIHNVSWVDFFELEPRRGLGNLAALPVPLPVSKVCPADSIPVLDGDGVAYGCVEAIEPELNRAYDTYGSPDTDPAVAPPMAAEVYGLNANSPLASDEKFIVVLANGDLTGGRIQIGCRVWDVEQYQDMITQQLELTSPVLAPNELDDCKVNGVAAYCPDTIHPAKLDNSLVFTLDSIANGQYIDAAGTPQWDGGDCAALNEDLGLSTEPTLRIAFTQRDILDGGIHGTRPQCVLGLHDYRDKVCYSDAAVLGNAKADIDAGVDPTFSFSSCQDARFDGAPNGEPPAGYIRDPARNLHITESLEGDNNKWRWRNGALTLQLLKVNKSTMARAFNLQEDTWLPQRSRGQRIFRFGGTYAQAFDTVAKEIDPTTLLETGKIYPLTTAPDIGEGAWNESGLLYESSLYWHYSDLAENLRRAEPSSLPCYGDSSYNSALTQELGGLTLGEYNALIGGLGDEDEPGSLIAQYASALEALAAALASGDQDAINQALLDLGELLEGSTALQDYAQYRDYAPGHIPEQHLLDLDKGQLDDSDDDGNTSTEDGTPADVEDLTGFGMGGGGGSGQGGGTAGNDVLEGLRIWIDPRD